MGDLLSGEAAHLWTEQVVVSSPFTHRPDESQPVIPWRAVVGPKSRKSWVGHSAKSAKDGHAQWDFVGGPRAQV